MIETNNNGSGGSAGRSSDAQQQASSSTNYYNLDRDPLSVQIRSLTGLLSSRMSVPSASSSPNNTGSDCVSVSQNLVQVTTATPPPTNKARTPSKTTTPSTGTLEDFPPEDGAVTADAALPTTNIPTTDPVMEKVASNTMKFASELNEEREREQLRLQAIQQHSPSQEYLRQMQEATRRSQAEEDARIKLEMLNNPQRQESERLDQWLAEESAQIQAQHDLQIEKQKEKEEAEAAESGGEAGAEAELKVNNKDGINTKDENNDVAKETKTSSAKMTGWVAPPASTEQDGKSFVVLFSSFGSNLQQKTNQERLRTILSSNGIVPVEIDASKPENKELRNDLFEVSGIRGQFPQIFIEDDDFNYTFIGGFDEIEALNDSGTLLAVLRDDNDGTENLDANAVVANENGDVTNTHKEDRVYEVDVEEYEDNDERRENFDRDIPPSLSSASSSDGWFDDIPDGDDQILSQSVDKDGDIDNDKANPEAAARTRSPIGSIHIVSDHAAGHGEPDDKTNNKKKSFLESTLFSPQAGMAAVAVIAGIAIWMSRGSRR